MQRVIKRYALPINNIMYDEISVEMPAEAEIFALEKEYPEGPPPNGVKHEFEYPHLFALVDEAKPLESRKFIAVGAGFEENYVRSEKLRYLSVFDMAGKVFVFEVLD